MIPLTRRCLFDCQPVRNEIELLNDSCELLGGHVQSPFLLKIYKKLDALMESEGRDVIKTP